MSDMFEQVRQQIHQIRNLIGPVNLKLADLEYQIIKCKVDFEERTLTLESKLLGALFRIDQHDMKLVDVVALQKELLEKMKKFERKYPI
ncbi:MAG TPA: hypothetical protein VGJ73_04070 [Verrucomicrobiae bacterium]|jgi:hypothetical protein